MLVFIPAVTTAAISVSSNILSCPCRSDVGATATDGVSSRVLVWELRTSVLIIAVLVQILSSLRVSASPRADHGVDGGMRSWLDFRQAQGGRQLESTWGESCTSAPGLLLRSLGVLWEAGVPGEEGRVPACLGVHSREGRVLKML